MEDVTTTLNSGCVGLMPIAWREAIEVHTAEKVRNARRIGSELDRLLLQHGADREHMIGALQRLAKHSAPLRVSGEEHQVRADGHHSARNAKRMRMLNCHGAIGVRPYAEHGIGTE